MAADFEKYRKIFENTQGTTIRPGQTFAITVPGDSFQASAAKRLFFTGETALFYLWKNEPDYPAFYRQIDDALSYEQAGRGQYCLDMSSGPLEYVKRVYKKILWPPVLSYLNLYGHTDQWHGGVWVKAEDLSTQEGGYLQLIFEVREKKPGISRHSVTEPPIRTYTANVPRGTYGWQKIDIPMQIPCEKTASVCCYLEGTLYSGKVCFESPFLTSSNGYNILPDFSVVPAGREEYGWLGQNLSRKEWPEFEIRLNGQLIFSGEIFERSHRWSETELELPAGSLVPGANRLEWKLISSYREALPYSFREVGIIETGWDDFTVIFCPENVPAGRAFAVLIETRDPGINLRFTSEKGDISPVTSLFFDKPGLHAVKLICAEPANDAAFKLVSEGHSETCGIRRVVKKPVDEILTGTGDEIYIHQDLPSMKRFLCWYMASGIGNMMTVRPTYRWSGSRELNPEVWRFLCGLLNELDVKYAHMLDGRELPGSCANPPVSLMEGRGFLGRQTHELDGAYAYWGFKDLSHNYMEELYYDVWMREYRENPETVNSPICPSNYIMKGETLSFYRSRDIPDDMEQACRFFINQLKKSRGRAVRHTGPSVLFRYFFLAGYQWVGAELMYGPMELVIAALRGAAECYGQTQTGGHLAVQWSTSPHNTPEHTERYRIALYVSYIQGLTQINTEEGLWHIEEYYSAYNRFTQTCRSHLKVQQDFYRYVSSHSRTGRLYTGIAFLQGRCDGWQCFGRNTVWGHPTMHFSKPEESWDLLKIFYPVSRLEAIYRHPCQEGPVGFYTGTPYGNVNIIPIEGSEQYGRYRVLLFLGYNKAEADDCGHLLEYVDQGGNLVLGWPHLSVTTDRQKIINYAHRYIRHRLVDEIAGSADYAPHFVKDSFHQEALEVSDSVGLDGCRVLIRTDNGRALAFSKKVGNGTVFFVNAKGYPAEAGLKPVYTEIIERLAEQNQKEASESGTVECGNDVQFAVYQQDDGSKHIYILAVDSWYNHSKEPRTAVLVLKGKRYPIRVPADKLLRISISGEWAAWVADDVAEILRLASKGGAAEAALQGYGSSELFFANGGNIYRRKVNFSKEPCQTVRISG